MSKHSQQKQKAKRKAATKRAQRTTEDLRKGEKSLTALIESVSDIDFAKKIKPDSQSVRFMGITPELLIRATTNTHDIINTELPLEDFVMRTKSGDNYNFDIHWLPFESSISAKDIGHALYYQGKTYRSEYRYHIGDPLIATIYARCTRMSINMILFLYYSKMTNSYEYVYLASGKEFDRIPSEKIQDRVANFVFYSALLAQRLTTCHIKNLPITFNTTDDIEEAIKQIQQYEEEDRLNNPTARPNRKPSPSTSSPAPHNPNDCVAYIHYHADTNDITISHRPHRGYKMRWWIVAEHERHLKDGRTILIPAYIKGDNADEDAIRALEVYRTMQRKITCFKVVPT